MRLFLVLSLVLHATSGFNLHHQNSYISTRNHISRNLAIRLRHNIPPKNMKQSGILTLENSSNSNLETATAVSAPILPKISESNTDKVQRTYNVFPWTSKRTKKTHDINYRVEGPMDGKPILLIHGFGGNVNHFRYQFPALTKEGYRVYAIDLLGFGASPKPNDEDYSIQLWTDLVTDFITEREKTDASSSSWVIGGNSIGGLVSLNACKELPDLVDGCVLFCCAGGMSIFRYEYFPLIFHPLVYFFQKVVFGPTVGSFYFQNFSTRKNVETILKTQVYRDITNVNEELLELILAPASDDGAKDVFLKVFAGDPGPTPESILPHVQCPILGLWGSADAWTPPDTGGSPATEFSQYTDNFQLQILPGAGHCAMDEVPDLCHETLIPWLHANINGDRETKQ